MSQNLAPKDLVDKGHLSSHSSLIFKMSQEFSFAKLCVICHVWMFCDIFSIMQTASSRDFFPCLP